MEAGLLATLVLVLLVHLPWAGAPAPRAGPLPSGVWRGESRKLVVQQ